MIPLRAARSSSLIARSTLLCRVSSSREVAPTSDWRARPMKVFTAERTERLRWRRFSCFWKRLMSVLPLGIVGPSRCPRPGGGARGRGATSEYSSREGGRLARLLDEGEGDVRLDRRGEDQEDGDEDEDLPRFEGRAPEDAQA